MAAGAALVLALSGLPHAAAQEVRTPRLDGESRFQTAVRIAAERTAGEQQSIETVVLARADDYPDALTGAGLASAVGGTDGSAPILLTDREALPTATSRALERFSVRRVVLLGGTAAISQGVEDQLARDYDVMRVAGSDRYATAAAAARRLVAGTGGLGRIDGRTTVLLAHGGEFADALAGGPVAYAAQLPILLTGRDSLPAATASVLDELGPEQVLVLGGEAAVSPAVESQVQRQGISTRRLGGADRLATAASIADFAVSEVGFDGRAVVLARGDAFPDALTGAPQAGRTRAPILLTQGPTALGAPTRDWLVDHSDTVGVVQVLGGTGAVSAATAAQAQQAAGSTSDGGQAPFPADRSPDTATASDGARLNVVDMRFGRHAGYDRVVLELAGTGSPGWRVEYVEDPRRQGSGHPVELRGSSYLKVDITGVIYPVAPDGRRYTGPEEILPERSVVVLEADMGGVFEGHRQAFLGLSSREPFRVFSLQDPTRIVIDVQHPTGDASG